MREERGTPYQQAARGKGLSDEVVSRRRGVPNARRPSVAGV